jgi:hypothetical protein
MIADQPSHRLVSKALSYWEDLWALAKQHNHTWALVSWEEFYGEHLKHYKPDQISANDDDLSSDNDDDDARDEDTDRTAGLLTSLNSRLPLSYASSSSLSSSVSALSSAASTSSLSSASSSSSSLSDAYRTPALPDALDDYADSLRNNHDTSSSSSSSGLNQMFIPHDYASNISVTQTLKIMNSEPFEDAGMLSD